MLQDSAIKAVWGDHPRKWMFDDYFDLYVWYRPDGSVLGFQLCYDKEGDQRAFTWMSTGTFQHCRIDTGESKPTANRSPILTKPCPFKKEPVRAEFLRRSVEIEAALRELILGKIDAFPSPIDPV